MLPPGDKPGKSTWFYFREAAGFEHDRGKAVIVYKAERGHADLQFSSTSAAGLALVTETILQPGMAVVPANKSASIRLSVPPLDFQRGAEDQIVIINRGLAACEILRDFYCTHRAQLRG